jgi:hypothetical protein
MLSRSSALTRLIYLLDSTSDIGTNWVAIFKPDGFTASNTQLIDCTRPFRLTLPTPRRGLWCK